MHREQCNKLHIFLYSEYFFQHLICRAWKITRGKENSDGSRHDNGLGNLLFNTARLDPLAPFMRGYTSLTTSCAYLNNFLSSSMAPRSCENSTNGGKRLGIVARGATGTTVNCLMMNDRKRDFKRKVSRIRGSEVCLIKVLDVGTFFFNSFLKSGKGICITKNLGFYSTHQLKHS